MKTYRNLYPQVYDFENLYESYRAARRAKRDRAEVARFEARPLRSPPLVPRTPAQACPRAGGGDDPRVRGFKGGQKSCSS
jgi:hypothetical protein